MTLFATHYHELTNLGRALPRVRNLEALEIDSAGKPRLAAGAGPRRAPSPQLSLFAPELHPALKEVLALDLDGMTPREALDYLARRQRRLREEG